MEIRSSRHLSAGRGRGAAATGRLRRAAGCNDLRSKVGPATTWPSPSSTLGRLKTTGVTVRPASYGDDFQEIAEAPEVIWVSGVQRQLGGAGGRCDQ